MGNVISFQKAKKKKEKKFNQNKKKSKTVTEKEKYAHVLINLLYFSVQGCGMGQTGHLLYGGCIMVYFL